MHLLSLISFPLGYCRVSHRFVFDLSDFLLVEILLCILIIILVKGIFELKLSKLEFAMAKTSEATNYLEELVNLEALQKKECKYFNKMLRSAPKCAPKIPSVVVTSKPDLINTGELSKHSISNPPNVDYDKLEISKGVVSKTNVKIDEPDEKSNKIITKESDCTVQVPAKDQVHQSNTSLARSQAGSSKKSERRSRLPVPPKPKTPVDPSEAGDSTKMNVSHSAPTQSVEETWKTNAPRTDFSSTCFVNSDLHPSETTYSVKFTPSKASNSIQPMQISSSYSNPNSDNRSIELAAHRTSSSTSKIIKSSSQSLTSSNINREKCPSKVLRGTSKHAIVEKSSRTSTSRCSSRGSSS